MPKPLDALDYLSHPKKYPAVPVCVLFGDEAYLKRQTLLALREEVLGEEGEFSLGRFDGDEVPWREVSDELSTVALFGGGKRLVVVEDGDDFVSRNRSLLEDYAARPKSTAVLVLEVKSWPSNTRLFKALAESGLQIECKFPAPARLLKWLASQAQTHDARLDPAAAETLVEAVEPDLGLFDQELTKLAALAGSGGTITAAMVHEAVGGWRTRTTWEMLDAALAGNTAAALVQLDRLLAAGEVPIALLGQIASTLRRFAAATRRVEQAERAGRRISLRQALEEAGFKPFVLSRAEPQLRQLGRVRGSNLYRWLLEADLALKGSNSAPARARLVLEELLVRLSARSPSLAGGPAG